MTTPWRSYRYVGPAELVPAERSAAGRRIADAETFDDWASAQTATERVQPFTFVVDVHGVLCLAPRRSEHVVCAGGGDVLSAGEVTFARVGNRWGAVEVTNQSTGYCPDVSSWPAVAAALDQVGLDRPPGFTHEVVFRRCEACRRLNIVREGDFFCVFCEHVLPQDWNVDVRRQTPRA
ncbi:hypothetical protein [Streptomyces sp. NPDC087270]|uniref:hypothetical protein n=1 Tax=Streptomyces sp. NPDC087270 TaxID=3365774 RepID=UPI00380D002A